MISETGADIFTTTPDASNQYFAQKLHTPESKKRLATLLGLMPSLVKKCELLGNISVGLFGSVASGAAGEQSDVDCLIFYDQQKATIDDPIHLHTIHSEWLRSNGIHAQFFPIQHIYDDIDNRLPEGDGKEIDQYKRGSITSPHRVVAILLAPNIVADEKSREELNVWRESVKSRILKRSNGEAIMSKVIQTIEYITPIPITSSANMILSPPRV